MFWSVGMSKETCNFCPCCLKSLKFFPHCASDSLFFISGAVGGKKEKKSFKTAVIDVRWPSVLVFFGTLAVHLRIFECTGETSSGESPDEAIKLYIKTHADTF